jgi:hypothetical protein
MDRMRWIGLGVLLAVGAMFFASTTAQAGNGHAIGQAQPLPLYNTGVEPPATGEYTLTKERIEGYTGVPGYFYCSYQVTITCQDLTPGATYSVNGVTFAAKGNGAGRATFRWYLADWDMTSYLAVDRLDPDGSATVLTSR